jgi:hypothetical protein
LAERIEAVKVLLATCALAMMGVATAFAEEVAVIASVASGERTRALLLRADQPVGAVILLAGGDGALELGPKGAIGRYRTDPLVRMRHLYAEAGFHTLVPDLGTLPPEYRVSNPHARRLGELVQFFRPLGLPVTLVGVSRSALSVTNAALRLTGAQAPDAVVILSGVLMRVDGQQASVQRDLPGFRRVSTRILLVAHRYDRCAYSLASDTVAFSELLTSASRKDVMQFEGGEEGDGNPCWPLSHHGFYGIEGQVVEGIASWLKRHAKN